MSPVGFGNRQLAKLARDLDPSHVRTRRDGDKALAYVEGWFVVAEANRIFGYDGWDRETIDRSLLVNRRIGEQTSCAYAARVRISVRAGDLIVRRDGTGVGRAMAGDPAEAHERALKAAETDATKRALTTFGGRFGLLLYDPDRRAAAPAAEVSPRPEPTPAKGALAKSFSLRGPDGCDLERLSAEAFCTGLRQLLEAAPSVEEAQRLWSCNADALAQLRSVPHVLNAKGEHFADLLERLLEKRVRALAPRGASADTKSASVRLFTPAPPYPLRAVAQRLGQGQDGSEQPTTPQPGPKSAGCSLPPVLAAQAAPVIVGSATGDAAPTRRSAIGGGYSVDKSQLAVASERRLRSKAHLVRVASLPCLVCEGGPCHAHHITFAQPRGLSQKVSDEFTVPLCVEHHNDLHRNHSEAAWWRGLGIEPIPVALRHWQETSMRQALPGDAR